MVTSGNFLSARKTANSDCVCSSFEIGDYNTSWLQLGVVLDPIGEAAQRFSAILQVC
jgi:hypothetical protein